MEQISLLLRDQKRMASLDSILSQPDFKSALKLCKSISGLDDKQITGTLDIDAGQWSRIWNNGGHFPENKLLRYMELCQNVVPLIWLAHKAGYSIQPLKTDIERERDEALTKLAESEKKLSVITDFMKTIKGIV